MEQNQERRECNVVALVRMLGDGRHNVLAGVVVMLILVYLLRGIVRDIIL
jgi:hypothetical protein